MPKAKRVIFMKVTVSDCITNALCVAEVSTAMVVHGIRVKKEEFSTTPLYVLRQPARW